MGELAGGRGAVARRGWRVELCWIHPGRPACWLRRGVFLDRGEKVRRKRDESPKSQVDFELATSSSRVSSRSSLLVFPTASAGPLPLLKRRDEIVPSQPSPLPNQHNPLLRSPRFGRASRCLRKRVKATLRARKKVLRHRTRSKRKACETLLVLEPSVASSRRPEEAFTRLHVPALPPGAIRRQVVGQIFSTS